MFKMKELFLMGLVLFLFGVAFYYLSGTNKYDATKSSSAVTATADEQPKQKSYTSDDITNIIELSFGNFEKQPFVYGKEKTSIVFSGKKISKDKNDYYQYANNDTEFYIFDKLQLVKIKAEDIDKESYNEILFKINKESNPEQKTVFLNKKEVSSDTFNNSFSSIDLSKYKKIFNNIMLSNSDNITAFMENGKITKVDMVSSDISVLNVNNTIEVKDIDDFSLRTIFQFEDDLIKNISQTYSITYKDGSIITTNVVQTFDYKNTNSYTADSIFDSWYKENLSEYQDKSKTVEADTSSSIVDLLSVYCGDSKVVLLDNFDISNVMDFSVSKKSKKTVERTFNNNLLNVNTVKLKNADKKIINLEIESDSLVITSISLKDFNYNGIKKGMTLKNANKILSDLGFSKTKHNEKDNIITYKSSSLDVVLKLDLTSRDKVEKLVLSLY